MTTEIVEVKFKLIRNRFMWEECTRMITYTNSITKLDECSYNYNDPMLYFIIHTDYDSAFLLRLKYSEYLWPMD